MALRTSAMHSHAQKHACGVLNGMQRNEAKLIGELRHIGMVRVQIRPRGGQMDPRKRRHADLAETD